MHRALSLAALLIIPTVELSAQRDSRGEDSDSTESSIAQAVAMAGGIGFSLLRLALHRNDNGPAQQFCYAACGNVRQAAALQLSAGPTPFMLHDRDNASTPSIARSNEPGRSDGEVAVNERSVRAGQAEQLSHDELFDYVEPPVSQTGLAPIIGAYPNDDGGQHPWNAGLDLGCAVHACSFGPPASGPTQPPSGGSVGEPGYDWAPGKGAINGPISVWEEVPVIVNPEPGTWAMLAAGAGVLALVRRRRR